MDRHTIFCSSEKGVIGAFLLAYPGATRGACATRMTALLRETLAADMASVLRPMLKFQIATTHACPIRPSAGARASNQRGDSELVRPTAVFRARSSRAPVGSRQHLSNFPASLRDFYTLSSGAMHGDHVRGQFPSSLRVESTSGEFLLDLTQEDFEMLCPAFRTEQVGHSAKVSFP